MFSYMREYGARIADNGFNILPIRPMSKVPGVMTNDSRWLNMAGWTRYCCSRPNKDFEIVMWCKWPDCGVGQACGWTVGVDIDIVQDPEVVKQIEAFCRRTLGDTPAQRIGMAPKKLLVYRTLTPFGGFKKTPIEILGRGQQFVAYGIHPETGQPYYWPGESLADLRFSDLPVVTEEQCRDFLEAAFEMIPPELRPQRLAEDGSNEAHVAAYYQRGTVEAIEDALPFIPNPDLPYEEWIRIGMALKGGLGDAAEALFHRWSALSKKNVPEVTARFFSGARPISIGAGTIYHVARTRGWKCPVHLTMNGAVAFEIGNHPAQGLLDAINAAVQTSQQPEEQRANIFVPDAIHQLTGVMKEFVDYTLATAHRQQRILAIGAAIAAIGVLAGRRYRSPTNLRTNVYIVGMAESGGGKDHARQCIASTFVAAGLKRFIGGSRLASGAGLLSALGRNPSSLFQLDEFGAFLKLAINPRAPKHVSEIWDYMTELATSAGSIFLGAEYADQRERPRQDIIEPCCVVHATTVPEPFWQALRLGMLRDGSFARWLLFLTDDALPMQNKAQREIKDISPALIEGLQAIAGGGGATGNLTDLAAGTPQPMIVPYDIEAAIALDELSEIVRQQQLDNIGSVRSALLARVWEHVTRIAMIYAISHDPARPVITLAAVEWSREIVRYCVETMTQDAGRYVSDNEGEATVKRVLEVIRRAGKEGIPRWQLVRKTRFLGSDRRRDEVLTELHASGQLIEVTNKTAGRNATVLRMP